MLRQITLECDRCGHTETIEDAGEKPMPWGQGVVQIQPPHEAPPRRVAVHLCPACSHVSDAELFNRPKRLAKASGLAHIGPAS